MAATGTWTALGRLAAHLAASLPLVIAATAAHAEVAKGYFVDCENGNDSASGTSPSDPWKTLGKVNSAVAAAGADVFLKAGTTCRSHALTVDWRGSASDRVIIGSYVPSGSTAQQGYAGSSRPTIRGTYASACRKATPSTCPVGMKENDRNAVPVNQWNGLITIRTSYVTVQDLALADSSGAGLVHIGGENTESNVTVENVAITQTLASGVRLEGVKNDVLRNNTMDMVSLIKVDGRGSVWPPGIMVTDAAPSNILIESNTVSNSAGEGIGILRSSHVIVRGNTVANNRRPLVYLDNASDNLVENNRLLGNGYLNGVDESYGVGVSIAVEPYNRGMRNSVQNVIRNNLMANTRGCFNLEVFRDSKHNCGGGQCADPASKGYKVGARIEGNTCLQDKARYVGSANLEVNDNVDEIEIVNNVFSAKDGNNCTLPTLPPSSLAVDANLFGTAPSDNDCRGTNSQIGATGIPLEFKRVHAGNVPTVDAFRGGASSTARRVSGGEGAQPGRGPDAAPSRSPEGVPSGAPEPVPDPAPEAPPAPPPDSEPDRKPVDLGGIRASVEELFCRSSAVDLAKVLGYECPAR